MAIKSLQLYVHKNLKQKNSNVHGLSVLTVQTVNCELRIDYERNEREEISQISSFKSKLFAHFETLRYERS